MQRLVDHVLAVSKESVKTFTYESLNNVVRLINGVSALLLTILPGNSSILEGIHGWELRPAFRGPRLPRWMEDGVSSFNQLIHELSVDSNASSSVEYSSQEDVDENIGPTSPLSQSSRASRVSSFTRQSRNWPPHLRATKRIQSLKDHFVQRAADRRRGVVEDLHLAIEIMIETVFGFVHKAAHCLLSPIVTFTEVVKWFFSHMSGPEVVPADGSAVSVPTDTLSENDPTPRERQTGFYHSLNTDARTCQDVITELGYPYEALRVVTKDGYILHLERIPRRDARKVVYLQHGVFDSSMGLLSCPFWFFRCIISISITR
ncbi:uncharacterized protein LOC132040414 isoform X3 [Lycium ferocissimum]|uniref:uncharacterized protein LOC132040414 isoform X3 n=1 Tax=Lycium ferocissimum TaxID=112874 RepID=UPI002815A9F9|nr:uncharacterized protein LOC132040414 isoform X3 [Lycium ferocissimum]